jgi:hypothetical protein
MQEKLEKVIYFDIFWPLTPQPMLLQFTIHFTQECKVEKKKILMIALASYERYDMYVRPVLPQYGQILYEIAFWFFSLL